MEPPTFSLEEMLTAIEKRLPGGRRTANAVFVLLIVWLVITAFDGILDSLLTFFEFLRSRQLPQFRTSSEAVSTLAAIVVLVVLGVVGIQWFSRMRGQASQIQVRLTRLSAVARLVQLKETATHSILNAKMPDAESQATWRTEFDRWMTGRHDADRQWQEQVITALPNAGATLGEVSRFRTLGTVKPVLGVAPADAHFKGMLAERLSRLDELIRTIEQRNME